MCFFRIFFLLLIKFVAPVVYFSSISLTCCNISSYSSFSRYLKCILGILMIFLSSFSSCLSFSCPPVSYSLMISLTRSSSCSIFFSLKLSSSIFCFSAKKSSNIYLIRSSYFCTTASLSSAWDWIWFFRSEIWSSFSIAS